MPNAVRKGVHTQSTSLLQNSISTNPQLQRTHSSDSSVSKLKMHAQSGGFLSRMDRADVGSSWPVFFHWSKLVFRNLVHFCNARLPGYLHESSDQRHSCNANCRGIYRTLLTFKWFKCQHLHVTHTYIYKHSIIIYMCIILYNNCIMIINYHYILWTTYVWLCIVQTTQIRCPRPHPLPHANFRQRQHALSPAKIQTWHDRGNRNMLKLRKFAATSATSTQSTTLSATCWESDRQWPKKARLNLTQMFIAPHYVYKCI